MEKITRLFGLSWVIACCICILVPAWSAFADPTIIDHRHTDITQIPQSAIEQAKSTLRIAYGHTSHGSQLTTGMNGLVDFANNGGLGLSLPDDIFAYNRSGSGGALHLRDTPFSGARDLGNPNRTAWADATRNYLDANSDVNVIIWSWCGQASTADEEDINTYLDLMNDLETEYPNVQFVYMTGHLDGSGFNGNLHLRNEQIRNYCNNNDKILYDFADIESYDPDGLVNYNELRANDNCAYDSDGNGSRDSNWATEWQDAHTQGYDWYSCSSAHSQALNANRKAYAAWHLWARLGGWSPSGTNQSPTLGAIGDQQVECDQQLTFTVTASDLDGGDTLTLDAAPLPDGATFDPALGLFSWTPTDNDEGDHDITFSVTDDGTPQGSDQETITISVVAPGGPPAPTNQSPTLDAIGDQQVECDQQLTFTVTASDLDGGDTLTLDAAPLPNGATFDPALGLFSWTPTDNDEGDHDITFSVTDDGTPQGSDQETITISVVAPGSPPAPSPSDQNDSDTEGCFLNSVLR